MERGWLGWAQTAHKRRPVLTLDVRGDSAVVICGTSTGGRDLGIVVDHKERAGRVLQLGNPTFFYVTNVQRINTSDITTLGLCPYKVLLAVDEMMTEYLRVTEQAKKYEGLVELTDRGIEYPRSPGD